MPKTPWPLRSGRLLLRDPRQEDVGPLLAFRNDPEANRFTIRTREDPDEFREKLLSAPGSDSDFTCVGELDGAVVALGLLHVVDGGGQPGTPRGTDGVVGYLVDPAWAGQGVATALARGLLAAAFERLGLRRVTAGVYADNLPSVRVLEKVGMRREQHGIEDSWHPALGWVDGYQYGLLAREWPGCPGKVLAVPHHEPTSAPTVTEPTARALLRVLLERQAEHRVPAVYGAVARHGRTLWQEGVGSADVGTPGVPPDADTQFLVASNTKTFTAVLVMALRDEGRLDLGDTLDQHVPEAGHTGITLRQMLAHVSGMQREAVGDVFETLDCPDRQGLVRGFPQAERVHRPHHLWHYSNLVYAMLGEVVARVDGRDWSESLRARILEPLGMRRTTLGYAGKHVTGYHVSPYSDVPVPEPVMNLKALAPAAALASTAEDMLRWGAFVADPVDEVLHPDTVEEMCEPQVMADRERWQLGFGLGFMLLRSGDRIFTGHTGGMPGNITGLFTHRPSGTTGLALMNSSTAPDPAGLAVALATHVLEHDPPEPEPWLPGTELPEELAGVVGRWYSEGAPFVFSVRAGRLEARAADAPAHKPASVFKRVGPDLYRTTSGREAGELLRITRDPDGRVVKMNWATYLVTRRPLPFGARP